MAGFTKLFNTILTSTVWGEDAETKVVWITLLALLDKDGTVDATIPGISRISGVPIEKVEQAMNKFLNPDQYSRSSEFEGRRIEKIDGGYVILNAAKYRAKMRGEERTEYIRNYMRKRRENEKAVNLNVNNVNLVNPSKPIAEAEAEAKKEIYKEKKLHNQKQFTPPTLEEIKEYIKLNPKLSNVNAEDFFNGFNESNPPWIDTQGKPVRNWKLKLRTWSSYKPQKVIPAIGIRETHYCIVCKAISTTGQFCIDCSRLYTHIPGTVTFKGKQWSKSLLPISHIEKLILEQKAKEGHTDILTPTIQDEAKETFK